MLTQYFEHSSPEIASICYWIICNATESPDNVMLLIKEFDMQLLSVSLIKELESYSSNSGPAVRGLCNIVYIFLNIKNPSETIIETYFKFISCMTLKSQNYNNSISNVTQIDITWRFLEVCITFLSQFQFETHSNNYMIEQIKVNTSIIKECLVDLFNLIYYSCRLQQKLGDFSNLLPRIISFRTGSLILILEEIVNERRFNNEMIDAVVRIYTFLIENYQENNPGFFISILERKLSQLSGMVIKSDSAVKLVLKYLAIIQLCVQKLLAYNHNINISEFENKLNSVKSTEGRYDVLYRTYTKLMKSVKSNVTTSGYV